MPSNRFYLDEYLVKETEVQLYDEELHHLVHVMRVKEGEKLELINGKGQLAICRLKKKEKNRATCFIEDLIEEPQRAPQLILALALPRMAHLELIWEKSIELGVSALWVFPGLLSEKKEFSLNQEKRLSSIKISALKQCGRLFLPTLEQRPPLKHWTAPQGKLFFGDTKKCAPSILDHIEKVQLLPLIICIGPEKGFHPEEIDILENKLFAQRVKLSENILRAETAAIASVAIAGIALSRNSL